MPKKGAINTANSMAITTVIFPTCTIFFSDASTLIFFLKISRVKMVEILFTFPANEATTAAVKAANANPLSPTGNKFNNTG